MKILTIHSAEKIPADEQRRINSILRMEFQSDHIFKDESDVQYSATISLKDPSETIRTIITNSAQIPHYTLIINILDTDAGKIEQMTVRNGNVKENRSGSWEWNG